MIGLTSLITSFVALTSLVGWVGMAVGGLIWLGFELWGVFTGGPTTSDAVWALEKRWPLTRILVAVFVISLGAHFQFGTPILP